MCSANIARTPVHNTVRHSTDSSTIAVPVRLGQRFRTLRRSRLQFSKCDVNVITILTSVFSLIIGRSSSAYPMGWWVSVCLLVRCDYNRLADPAGFWCDGYHTEQLLSIGLDGDVPDFENFLHDCYLFSFIFRSAFNDHPRSCCAVVTARRNARIASAVLAMAFPSVCPSVCHTPVLCQNDDTQHGAICTLR